MTDTNQGSEANSAKNPTKNGDIAAKSFEQALKELEEIVQKLERGEVALEESITLYERGAALKSHCDAALAAAQEKLETMITGEDGTPALAPAVLES